MADLQTPAVDPSNAEQARAWDGDEGDYWATHAEQLERFLARYNARFLDAAGIHPTAHVLDVGCGTGNTTRAAARLAPAGTAFGVDLSSRMIDVARRLAERDGVSNVRFEQADAQIHPFAEKSIDIAISRTGAMFFGDPVAAFANIAGAVRPGGRLVLLVWQELARNEWISIISDALAAGRSLPAPPPEAPGPFSLSDPDRVRKVLERAGFTAVTVEGLREPMYFGRHADDAYSLVAGLTAWMLEGLDETGRARALGDLRAAIEAHQTEQGVLFESATWLVTAQHP